jgi:hypothetical protein
LASEKNAARSFVTTLKTLSTKFGDGLQAPTKIDFKPLEDVKERGNMVESETRSNGLVKQ